MTIQPATAVTDRRNFVGELLERARTKFEVRFRSLWIIVVLLPVLFAQTKTPSPNATTPPVIATSPNTPAGSAASWSTRSLQLKYLDPEQLRSIFSSRPFVMEVNRELRLLTVTGPSPFLDEVEQTGKRFDVAPPLPANLDITVYLLATPAQAPSGKDLPADLRPFAKSFEPFLAGQGARLADAETLRVREGQTSEVGFGDASTTGIRLAHISVGSAFVTQVAKGDLISINGLRCWLSKASGQGGSEADVTANIDVTSNQPVLVAKAGSEKPLAFIVRATVAR